MATDPLRKLTIRIPILILVGLNSQHLAFVRTAAALLLNKATLFAKTIALDAAGLESFNRDLIPSVRLGPLSNPNVFKNLIKPTCQGRLFRFQAMCALFDSDV